MKNICLLQINRVQRNDFPLYQTHRPIVFFEYHPKNGNLTDCKLSMHVNVNKYHRLWICFTYILMLHCAIMLLLIYFVFVSQIMRYFSHSTLLLSFYIDIVLTLSAGKKKHLQGLMHPSGICCWEYRLLHIKNIKILHHKKLCLIADHQDILVTNLLAELNIYISCVVCHFIMHSSIIHASA